MRDVPSGRWLMAIAIVAIFGVTNWADAAAKDPDADDSISLFDGKTLDGWKATDYGGQGDVYVEDGCLILEMGSDLTGVTFAKDPIRMDYEISLEAKRIQGSDFFCGLTFPVGDDACSLIVGGWGGGLVGLSSLDRRDASENETSSWKNFKDDQWYRIRVRVTRQRIQAWIDEEKVVDVETTGRKISIRPEVSLNKPLGIASFRTLAAIRKIEVRNVDGPLPTPPKP